MLMATFHFLTRFGTLNFTFEITSVRQFITSDRRTEYCLENLSIDWLLISLKSILKLLFLIGCHLPLKNRKYIFKNHLLPPEYLDRCRHFESSIKEIITIVMLYHGLIQHRGTPAVLHCIALFAVMIQKDSDDLDLLRLSPFWKAKH